MHHVLFKSASNQTLLGTYLGEDGHLRSVACTMVVAWSFLVHVWLPDAGVWCEDTDDIPVFQKSTKTLRRSIRAIQKEAEKRPACCSMHFK